MRSEIRRTFPGLYWVVMCVGVLLTAHGLWFLLGSAQSTSSPAYDIIREIGPIEAWGALWLGVGVAEIVTVQLPKSQFAYCRLVLLFGVLLTVMWFLGLVFAGPTGSPFLPLAIAIPQFFSMIEDPDKRLLR